MLAPVSATGRAMQIGMTSIVALAHRDVDDGLLDDPGPPARRSPASPTSPCGASGCSRCQVQVRADRAGRPQDVALDEVMEATADAVDSGLLQFSTGSVIGTGGMVETPNQRMRRAQRAAHRHPGRPRRGAGHGGRRAAASGSATSRRSWRTTSRSSATRSSTTRPGLLLVVEKLPWANTVAADARGRGRDPRPRARAARRPVRHHDLPAGQLHHRARSTTSPSRSSSASSSSW